VSDEALAGGADGAAVAEAIAALPPPVLLATDVDGTLSPIVEDPRAARLFPGALDELWFLALSGRRIAVISGRPMDDLVGLFGLPPEFLLIGSHGAEFGGPVELSTVERDRLIAVKRAFAKVLPDVPGAFIEHKPVAAAFHVRPADPALGAAALARLRLKLAAIPGITVHEGHCVIEAAVRSVHKAAAMATLLEREQPASVVFLGDDASDERVFTALEADERPTVTVKVGDGPTAAAWRVPDPAAVVAILRAVASK
jgi:trehalose 6-phosphate phosphatase